MKMTPLIFIIIFSFFMNSLLAKNGNTILIIIDVQRDFRDCFTKKTLSEIKAEIYKTKKNKDEILVLEYQDEGPTHKDLLHAIGRYDHVGFMTKNTDSGAREVIEYFKSKNYFPAHIEVTGVNSCACVYDTVLDLASMIDAIDLKVLSKGINCRHKTVRCKKQLEIDGKKKGIVMVPSVL